MTYFFSWYIIIKNSMYCRHLNYSLVFQTLHVIYFLDFLLLDYRKKKEKYFFLGLNWKASTLTIANWIYTVKSHTNTLYQFGFYRWRNWNFITVTNKKIKLYNVVSILRFLVHWRSLFCLQTLCLFIDNGLE